MNKATPTRNPHLMAVFSNSQKVMLRKSYANVSNHKALCLGCT